MTNKFLESAAHKKARHWDGLKGAFKHSGYSKAVASHNECHLLRFVKGQSLLGHN
jgi:hypothetical protein